jgi:N-acetylmuramoyl-L-alanine amidase
MRADSDENNTQKIILIDPGHGGVDGGARSKNGTIEKHINLSIATKLKKALEDAGYLVYMTREEDSQLDTRKAKDLAARCQMKKDTKCDAFVSIHQNMFPQANCFGAQVWYASNEYSKFLAEDIQNSLKEVIDDDNKRLAKAAKEQYKILRDGYEGASVIVECGFLSNYEEEQKLKSDEHQDKIVTGITNGINKYFEDKNAQ